MSAVKIILNDGQTFVAIHERAILAAANFKRSEIALLEAIADVEARQVYFQFEITSLFLYCVEILGLSRHASYDFITVMRKSSEVPAMLQAIRSGDMTVSKARKICSVINERNSKEWIELAQHCSTRVVERAVAMANPRSAITEALKYVSSDVLELKLAVSEEWSDLLVQVKDLMSQSAKRAVSTEEALFKLLNEYKTKHDPVLKAERVRIRSGKREEKESLGSETFESPTNPVRNRYIPAATRHKVSLRDDGKCTFIDRRGKRCGTSRWVQKHHVEHFANGGSHSAENLETLCWPHHVMKHRH